MKLYCRYDGLSFFFTPAFVWGEESGMLYESSFKMGDTLNGASGLDIDVERQVVEQELNELQAEGASEEAITLAMKDLGIKRFVLELQIQNLIFYLCFSIILSII